jgi:glycosyltransferase involved in cell wall biosynthesis
MAKKKFLTVFNDFEAVHLHKDVGAIPYHLATVCGWRSSLAFFEKREGMAEELAGTAYAKAVSLVSLGRWSGRFLNAARIVKFIATHGREYDVVHFYHDGVVTLLYALMFKFVRPGGVVYLKLDMSHLELQRILEMGTNTVPRTLRRLKHILSRLAVDIYTAETTYTCSRLAGNHYFRGRLHLLPNGFTCNGDDDSQDGLAGKENIILTVGRLGDPAKYNEVLVDAASALDPKIVDGWKVYFVGPVVNERFRSYAEEAIRRKPHLKDVFVFPGNVEDRGKLYEIYRKSRIFCMTSRWESFGFVYLEAMYFGNYVISSDLPAPRELTQDGAFGSLFPVGDVPALAGLISDALSGKIDVTRGGMESQRIVRERYDWRIIVRELDRLLDEAAMRLRG